MQVILTIVDEIKAVESLVLLCERVYGAGRAPAQAELSLSRAEKNERELRSILTDMRPYIPKGSL